MISLFLRGFLAFGATAVALFFYVNDDDDVNDDGLPHPCPSPQRGGELLFFLYHFRECTKMVNLKAYFVRLVEINDKI